MRASLTGIILVVLGLAIGAAGIAVGELDDAPGAALLGVVLMLIAIALGVRLMLRKNRTSPGRT